MVAFVARSFLAEHLCRPRAAAEVLLISAAGVSPVSVVRGGRAASRRGLWARGAVSQPRGTGLHSIALQAAGAPRARAALLSALVL